MSDLISRKAAIDALHAEIVKRRITGGANDGMLDEFDTESILRKLPSAQPERKKGKWSIESEELVILDVCSECEKMVLHKAPFYSYCPNCGADMSGEENG